MKFNRNSKIYIWGAPKGIKSGGAEVLCLLADTLKKMDINSKMFNFDIEDYEIDEYFQKTYNPDTCNFKEIENNEETLIIVPDLVIQHNVLLNHIIKNYNKCQIVPWILSLNYTGGYQINWINIVSKLRSIQNVHYLCESHFYYDFLKVLGVTNIDMLQHGTDIVFTEKPRTNNKENIVMYNGYKWPYNEMIKNDIAPLLPQYRFISTSKSNGHKTKEEMCEMYDSAKVYLDFCDFEGRELMPREACLRDCVILLNKSGCVLNKHDYPLNEWYKINKNNIEEVVNKIIDCIENYDNKIGDMRDLKKQFLNERNNFITTLHKIFGNI